MSAKLGNSGIVKLDTVGGTPAIAKVKSFNVNEAAETVDSSELAAEWNTHLIGAKSWEGSIEFNLDSAEAGQVKCSVGASLDVELYAEGDASELEKLTGTATVTAVGRSVERNAIVTKSVSITGNGPLVHDVIV